MIATATSVVGVAAVYEVLSDQLRGEPDGRLRQAILSRGALDDFIACGMAVPLRIGHDVTFTPTSIIPDVGTVRDYRIRGDRLLVRAELHAGELGASTAEAIRWGMLRAMSVGAYLLDATGDAVRRWRRLWLTEVSLVHRPRFAGCDILAVGEAAATLWERCR